MEIAPVSLVLRLDQMNHGAHFRASTLRDHGRTGALDPILGIDHAWMAAPTFPAHQHMGMSAVSYVFADAETGLDNQDSIGTRNLIRPGGLHWTAAGRGIVHEEVPAEEGKASRLLQIFVNLPASKQSAPPFALSLEPEDVPLVELAGAHVRVPLGEFGAARSPMTPPTRINLIDVTLDPGASIAVPVAGGENAFVVPVKGVMTINGAAYDAEGAEVPAFPASSGGQSISLQAGEAGAQAVVFSGVPVQLQH
jgi:redox-sensitive bicupin YhaK (pirin superfamily)